MSSAIILGKAALEAATGLASEYQLKQTDANTARANAK